RHRETDSSRLTDHAPLCNSAKSRSAAGGLVPVPEHSFSDTTEHTRLRTATTEPALCGGPPAMLLHRLAAPYFTHLARYYTKRCHATRFQRLQLAVLGSRTARSSPLRTVSLPGELWPLQTMCHLTCHHGRPHCTYNASGSAREWHFCGRKQQRLGPRPHRRLGSGEAGGAV